MTATSTSPALRTTRPCAAGRDRVIDGLAVRGDPPATVLAFGARDPDALDIFAVGERLAAEGWYLDRQNRPDSLHATVHAGSAATVPALVTDLRRAVKEVGTGRTDGATPPTGRL